MCQRLVIGDLAAAAAFVGGSANFWLSAAHGANVMNCVAELKGFFHCRYCVRQYQQQCKEEAKKKERAVELQEQAEVLAKVMKEQCDQTVSALSPSLITPPQFHPSPLGIPNLPFCC